MTYEESEFETITLKIAIRELSKHGFNKPADLADFFREVIPNRDGSYKARSVLNWLGY